MLYHKVMELWVMLGKYWKGSVSFLSSRSRSRSSSSSRSGSRSRSRSRWMRCHALSLLEGVCNGTNVKTAHSQTLMKENPQWADCSTVALQIPFHSAPLETKENRKKSNRVWHGEAGETRIFQTFAGIYSRDAPVLTVLTSVLGLSLQKIQLQVWKGLLSPEEVPLPLLLPRGETEAEPLQVLVWRQKEKAV